MADAMRLEIDDPLAKWVLVTLCDYANEAGECWPSTATLAKRTGMHRSSVAKKLNYLEERKLIKRIESPFDSNLYRVVVSDTPVAQSATNLLKPNIDNNRELCIRYKIEVEKRFGSKKFHHNLRQEEFANDLLSKGYTVDSFIDDAVGVLEYKLNKKQDPPYSLLYFIHRHEKKTKPIDVQGLLNKVVANTRL